ncbi:hypothetical protein BT69DRAFT_1299553 [Atractiella rhizophila]|nr:hypothetical protein BT69DRAFT_1299553 [Atractiella rhizophila]
MLGKAYSNALVTIEMVGAQEAKEGDVVPRTFGKNTNGAVVLRLGKGSSTLHGADGWIEIRMDRMEKKWIERVWIVLTGLGERLGSLELGIDLEFCRKSGSGDKRGKSDEGDSWMDGLENKLRRGGDRYGRGSKQKAYGHRMKKAQVL